MRKQLFFRDKKNKDKKFYEAKVLRIIDGDTIDVEHNYDIIRVRIKGIDAPESNQPYGFEAHKFLHDLIGGKTVYISTESTGKYKREIGKVFDEDHNNISEIMIAKGQAWADFTDSRFDPNIKQLQDHAQKQKIGLWAGDKPIQPKVWRENKMTMRPKEKEALKAQKKKYHEENNIRKDTPGFVVKAPAYIGKKRNRPR